MGSDHANPLKSRNFPLEFAEYQALKAGFQQRNGAPKKLPQYAVREKLLKRAILLPKRAI
jgi:hypothetical protein